ncbi:hypothetical protein [Haloplasma contractile]|uniref:Uncharacterized protein n=1 Tax=Haloplasma contractile SSD-17B TaxID=1033810 RepID=U2E961_9MOLU|nr:hypothetical protein [Haloplasma contractile]ERJ11678.1 hypothetical protein HLPCO_002379 [Haloplasma contractile SSD-17B]
MYLGLASIIALCIVILLNILRIKFKKIVSKKIPNVEGFYYLEEDTLIDTKTIHSKSKKDFSTNKIYQTNSYKNNTIKRYMISKNHKNLSLIYEYGENVNSVNILIYFYNKKQKLIYIFKVEEEIKSNYSKKIKIPRHTSYVKFVDYNDELETYYNQQLIRDRKLLIYDSISFFLMMFFISYWTVFILGGNLLNSYLDWFGILVNLMLILIITILNFTMNLNGIQKRNPNI